MYSHHKTEKNPSHITFLGILCSHIIHAVFVTYLKKRTETEGRQKGGEKVGKQKNNSYQDNLLTALSCNLCLNR